MLSIVEVNRSISALQVVYSSGSKSVLASCCMFKVSKRLFNLNNRWSLV